MEDQKGKSRARKTNFSPSELDVLISEVAQNSNYLFGKLSAVVTAAGKKRLWSEIAEKLNANGNPRRDGDEVRKKWTDYRSLVKKKEMMRRRELKKTGGGPSPTPLTEVEQRVAGLIPTCQLEGIEGGIESEYFETSLTESCAVSQSPPESEASVDTGNKCIPDTPKESSSSEDFMSSLHSVLTTHKTALRPPVKQAKMKNHTVTADPNEEDIQSIVKIEKEKLEVLRRVAEAMEHRNITDRGKLEIKKRRMEIESVLSIEPVIKF